MKYLASLLLVLASCITSAQSPKQIIALVNQKFARVNDYSASIKMLFNIPSVRLDKIEGKVFFKKPSKFRIRTKGIIFMPRQNPYYSLSTLADTNKFTAVATGDELVGSVNTTVIQVIPNTNDNDLILGKFWVDKVQNLIIKSQLTTKSSGTIQLENSFGASSLPAYALPDRMTLSVDMAKFRVPKMVSADLNSKSVHPANESKRGTGIITLEYSNYLINQKVPDSVFDEKDK